jgi:hypothetical protein
MLVNAYCTHRSPPAITFPHRLNARRDRRDRELAGHLDGFMGFVMDRGKRPMNAMRYAILRHLSRVQHHLSFDVDGAHEDALTAWAMEANAILFFEDATVRAPDGAVLVEPGSGQPEPGASVPYPRDAQTRKDATTRALAARGIGVVASLPPSVSEIEVSLRSASEVASRCFALFACAVRAESIANGDPIPSAEILSRMPHAVAAMSPNERAFFDARSPQQQDVVDHVWRYESLAVLAWSLGILPELPFPSGICDVGALAQQMIELDPVSAAGRTLRATPLLLDALDLTFRVHWAVTDARVNGGPVPRDVDPSVVLERHRALNWLTRFDDVAWDDVQTPT